MRAGTVARTSVLPVRVDYCSSGDARDGIAQYPYARMVHSAPQPIADERW